MRKWVNHEGTPPQKKQGNSLSMSLSLLNVSELLHASRTMGVHTTSGGVRSKQRPRMWPELNVYHVQGQWVTHFWELSFIRPKIYSPQSPLHSPPLFCLSWQMWSRRDPLCLFAFLLRGWAFLTKAPRVLNFWGSSVWKLFRLPRSAFTRACIPPTVEIWILMQSKASTLSPVVLLFGPEIQWYPVTPPTSLSVSAALLRQSLNCKQIS